MYLKIKNGRVMLFRANKSTLNKYKGFEVRAPYKPLHVD